MKRLILTILTMIFVLALAIWWLGEKYMEIDFQTRIIISAGASVFSGLISYLMFKGEKD